MSGNEVKSDSVMSDSVISDSAVSDSAAPLKPRRERLSPAPVDPVTGRPDPSLLKPHQQALRQAVVDAFNAKKARKFLQKHVHHISSNRELMEGIKFLFDEQGRAPANAPLEDIIEERRKIEYHILWLEGVLKEMRHRLIKIREVEDHALEILSRSSPDE
jgi:hypothetical protein